MFSSKFKNHLLRCYIYLEGRENDPLEDVDSDARKGEVTIETELECHWLSDHVSANNTPDSESIKDLGGFHYVDLTNQ